ncbi:MAG: hypothetical protein AAGE03_04350 [Pseudomonadota bacterium]
MSDTLALLTAHYERLKGQTYTVPGVTQADGSPLVIHFDPPTNAQAAAIERRAGGRHDEAKMTLYTVIECARGPDGKRLFEDNAQTVQGLTEGVPATILKKMALAILNASTVADLEK